MIARKIDNLDRHVTDGIELLTLDSTGAYSTFVQSYLTPDPAAVASARNAYAESERRAALAWWERDAEDLSPFFTWDTLGDGVHGLLDIIGVVDPTGIADVLNAGFYFAQGDLDNAGISLAGAILPYAGDLLKATRVVKSMSRAADGLSEVLGASRSLTCRMASAAGNGLLGAAAGAASAYAYGFVNTYIQTGDFGQAWDKGADSMGWGALQGGLGAAVRGFMNPYVCFVAGTQVVTGVTDESGNDALPLLPAPSGGVAVQSTLGLVTRSIETIRRGDRVLGKDQHDPSAPVRQYVVEETYVRTIDHLRFLTIRDSLGREQTLKTTDDHPFYVANEGWANACKLVAGDKLLEPDGSWSELITTAREEHPEGVTVYNFQVRQAHTYLVRAQGATAGAVWVHNASYDKRSVDEAIEKGVLKLVKAAGAGAARSPRHHVFSQRLFGSKKKTQAWFKSRGVDIDKITIELTEGVHSAIHKWVGSAGWNSQLRTRLLAAERDAKRRVTAREVWNEGYRLLRQAGIRNPTFVPYKG